MQVRLKFQKYGAMKFVGHLDVMRYFQKAFRRAGLDSEYSKGFNPHQVMSFGAPLGLGLTSDSEYVDIGLNTSQSPENMIKKINEVMSEGFYVTGFHMLKEPELNEKKVTAMSLMSSADYLVSLKDGYYLSDSIVTGDQFREAFERFYGKPDIFINKKTKKSETLVNIKPMISLISFNEMDYNDRLKDLLLDLDEPTNDERGYSLKSNSRAEVYENDMRIYMQLDTGSVANLKPELVMEAFCNDHGIGYNPYAWQIHRLEIYTRDKDSERLIPLDRYEK